MPSRIATGTVRSDANIRLSQFRRRIRPMLRKIETWPLSSQKPGERLVAYYQVGSELLKLNSTGDYALAELKKKAVGRGRRWQLETRRFAEQYDQRQLRDLCKQADNINWGHVRLMLWLPPKDREKWLKMSHRQGWGALRFRRELKRRGVLGGPGESGGRPLGGSRTQPEERVEQLIRLTDDWANLAREVFKGRKKEAMHQFRGFDTKFWNRLRKAMASTAQFQKKCKEFRDQLDRAIATARRNAAKAAERRSTGST